MNDFAFIAHYGIKGQKWGVRRYQNPDGSYTEAGLARRKKYYKDTLVRRIVAPELRKKYSMSKHQERRLREEFLQYKSSIRNTPLKQDDIDRLNKMWYKYAAVKIRNQNRKYYARSVSTGRLFMQNFWLGSHAGVYREARTRGNSFADAILEAYNPVIADYENARYYGYRGIVRE